MLQFLKQPKTALSLSGKKYLAQILNTRYLQMANVSEQLRKLRLNILDLHLKLHIHIRLLLVHPTTTKTSAFMQLMAVLPRVKQ